MSLIVQTLLTGVAIALTARFLPGVTVGTSTEGFINAVIIGILLAVVNSTVGSLLRLITLPINFLSLGLVSFLITLLVIYIVDMIIPGFSVDGFISYILFAIISGFLTSVLGGYGKKVLH